MGRCRVLVGFQREGRRSRRPAACTTRAQTRPAWMSMRIPLFPRSEPVCFTVTSASGRTVTVLPSRKVMRARPFRARLDPVALGQVHAVDARRRPAGARGDMFDGWGQYAQGGRGSDLGRRGLRYYHQGCESHQHCHYRLAHFAHCPNHDRPPISRRVPRPCAGLGEPLHCQANSAPRRSVPRFAGNRVDSITRRIDPVRTRGGGQAGCPCAKRSPKALRGREHAAARRSIRKRRLGGRGG